MYSKQDMLRVCVSVVLQLSVLYQLLFVNGNYGGDLIRWKAITSLIDVNFTTNVTIQYTTEHMRLCGMLCFKDEMCQSFEYNFQNNICQGHGQAYLRKESNDFQITAGVKYFIPDCEADYILAYDLQLCFKMVYIGMPYQDARNHCEATGDRLLKIDSNRKVQYFDNYLNRPEFDAWDSVQGTEYYGLWLNGEYSNGLWVDASGNEMQNIQWEPNAPQQPFNDTCISLAYTFNGHWPFNRNCNNRYGFICEKILK